MTRFLLVLAMILAACPIAGSDASQLARLIDERSGTYSCLCPNGLTAGPVHVPAMALAWQLARQLKAELDAESAAVESCLAEVEAGKEMSPRCRSLQARMRALLPRINALSDRLKAQERMAAPLATAQCAQVCLSQGTTASPGSAPTIGGFAPGSTVGLAPGGPPPSGATPNVVRPDSVPGPWTSVIVGEVRTVAGRVTVRRGQEDVPLTVGMPIRYGEVIKTDARGLLSITFIDETHMSMGPNAQFVIDDFFYDASKPPTRKKSMRVIAGAFRFVTGAKPRRPDDDDEPRVRTPYGNIGIKGTDFSVEVTDDGSKGVLRAEVFAGEIVVFDLKGRVSRLGPGDTLRLEVDLAEAESSAIEQALESGQPLVQGSNHFIPFPGSRFGISVDMDQWQREPTQSHPKAISFLFRSSLMVGTLGVHPDLVLSENEVEPNLRADFPAGIANPQLISQERIVLNGLVVTRLRYKASIGPQDVLIDAHVYSGPQGVARIGVIRPSGRDDLAPHAERFIAGLRVR